MYFSIFFYSQSYYLLVIYMINYLKSILYSLIFLLIGTIILTILNYFNLLNGIPLKIVMLLIPLIAIIIGSFIIGKYATKKGYFEGLKYGVLWTVTLLLTNIIMKTFDLTSIIYYIALILLSMFSASIGINRKKQ